MRLCVIPARGGSKRIPRKNIKEFFGKPMIAWSILKAIESRCFDKIIVSTDDAEIAEISKEFGAEVPFLRPQNLSDDYTGTTEVIAHAINWFLQKSISFTDVCCLYATAPFVQSSDLLRGFEILSNSKSTYAFSVTSFAFPIQRAVRLCENERVEMFHPEHLDTRSQDLEEAWHDAGQFYWGKSTAWTQLLPIFSKDSSAVKLPRHRVQDIDTVQDWERAECLFKVLNFYKT
jgi:N-acylneuraminate cytidylyltransferase